MSEKLRLEAEFRDKGVQSGLKKIGTELAVIKKTPGMTEAHKWLGEFNERANKFVTESGGVKGVLTGMGVGGLTAATSIAELVKSFAEMGRRTADMKEVARQTGLTVDEVNRLQRAGERLYIDPSKMTAGLETAADHMADFRHQWGDLYGQLSAFDPDFARKLSLEKPEEQIRDIFNWLSKIKDPVLQRRWTEAFMGDGDLARLLTNGGRDFAQAMQDAAKHAAGITPELGQQAKAFHDSVLDFNDTWDAVRNGFGPTVLAGMNDTLHEFQGLLKNLQDIEDWWNGKETKDSKLSEVKDRWAVRERQFNGQGDFAPAQSQADADMRRQSLEGERAAIQGKDDEKNRIRVEEIDAALVKLKNRIEDSNALHKGDVAPLDWIARQKAAERASRPDAEPEQKSLWSRLFQRSAFVEGGDEGSSASLLGSPAEVIADGTRQGVLAAFREMMAEQDAKRDGARKAGIQNAAFETYDDETPGRGNGYSLKGLGQSGDASPARGLYDAIAQAEGTTKDGFNTTLGYGKWGTPDKPLTEMTLKEVEAFGLKQRQAQQAAGKAWGDTSSANGKFQITGSTMMDAARALGLDPASTKFDGPTQERMAAWIAKTQGLGAWEGFKSHPDQLAEARRSLGTGDLRGETEAPSGDADAPGRAVDLGVKLNGASRDQAARALGARLTPGEWCADFVNGALHAAGSKGVNSSIANSFLNWGHEVAKEAARKGDVLVEDRGRGAGMPGGHAGLYTGHDRMRNGRRQLEMLSGNYGDRVQAHDWVDASKLHVGRQMNLPEVARKSAPPDQTIRHEGGAAVDINLRSDGTVHSTRTKTRGLVTAVNLTRGPTMMRTQSA